MAFSEIELKRIDKIVGELCRRRSPVELRDEIALEYKVEGHDILIYERRPQWDDPSKVVHSPMAKLRFVRAANTWRLFWQRANLKWVAYEPHPDDRDLAALVRTIDIDQFGCFFG